MDRGSKSLVVTTIRVKFTRIGLVKGLNRKRIGHDATEVDVQRSAWLRRSFRRLGMYFDPIHGSSQHCPN